MNNEELYVDIDLEDIQEYISQMNYSKEIAQEIIEQDQEKIKETKQQLEERKKAKKQEVDKAMEDYQNYAKIVANIEKAYNKDTKNNNPPSADLYDTLNALAKNYNTKQKEYQTICNLCQEYENQIRELLNKQINQCEEYMALIDENNDKLNEMSELLKQAEKALK